jgi:hypothetical protein
MLHVEVCIRFWARLYTILNTVPMEEGIINRIK